MRVTVGMSALGQKQTLAPQNWHVRFTPKSEINCDIGECLLLAQSGHELVHRTCPPFRGNLASKPARVIAELWNLNARCFP